MNSCEILGLMVANDMLGASHMLEMYHDEITRSIKTYTELIGESVNVQDLEALFIEALITFKHALYAVTACNETIKKTVSYTCNVERTHAPHFQKKLLSV
ncbi:MAG: hypothetical protein IE909_11720 [Campylobacterales bacterium]|nr:hypothetical protein [Campylobacterales bacterium]